MIDTAVLNGGNPDLVWMGSSDGTATAYMELYGISAGITLTEQDVANSGYTWEINNGYQDNYMDGSGSLGWRWRNESAAQVMQVTENSLTFTNPTASATFNLINGASGVTHQMKMLNTDGSDLYYDIDLNDDTGTGSDVMWRFNGNGTIGFRMNANDNSFTINDDTGLNGEYVDLDGDRAEIILYGYQGSAIQFHQRDAVADHYFNLFTDAENIY